MEFDYYSEKMMFQFQYLQNAHSDCINRFWTSKYIELPKISTCKYFDI